jgi:hypothetical protein
MGISGGGQPNIPGPTLAGFGKGRFGPSGRGAAVHRYDGSGWREVARYPTTHEAEAAIDVAVGDGAAPGTLRVVAIGPTIGVRVAMAVGVAIVVVVAAFVVYVVFG